MAPFTRFRRGFCGTGKLLRLENCVDRLSLPESHDNWQKPRYPMQLEADVSRDGVLRAKLPDKYRGKHVRISIQDDDERALSQWAALSEILDGIENQDIPRRSHREILESLREFRESK